MQNEKGECFMKVIAFYLPQFHSIPENDKWWGKGFTEWVNVKKATPLFPNHYQPRVPLNKNYYNLLDPETMKWQVETANDYGIYGFCFYHYWFSGKKLLEKPVEAFLERKELNTHFCLCWANESWTNTWANGSADVIMQQSYGGKNEWKEHFDYLLDYFKDDRYIVNNNKPLLVIYRPELIDCLDEMLTYWNQLAKQNGFDGIEYAYQNVSYYLSSNRNDELFSYAIEYQPNWAFALQNLSTLQRIKKDFLIFVEKRLKFNLREKLQVLKGLQRCDYAEIWNYILNSKPNTSISVPCAFVDWDNTPRKGKRGMVVENANPVDFKKFFTQLLDKAEKEFKQDMVFVFAWNEWAEGGYLEPDEKYRYEYLKAIKDSLDEFEERRC